MAAPALAALLLAAPLPALAEHEGGAAAGHGVEAGQGRSSRNEEPRRGRLRFRGDGPVCMCSLGMSEEDIQRAQEERRQSGGWRRR